MLLNHILILILCLSFYSIGCNTIENGPTDTSTENSTNQEFIDEEFYSWLDSLQPDNSININSITFEDGTPILEYLKAIDPDFVNSHGLGKVVERSPYEQKRELIAKMVAIGIDLTKRSKWKNYNGSNQPNGLAYVWGGKDHLKPTIPVPLYDTILKKNIPNICQEQLYGLDCSGMIAQMAKEAGIIIPKYQGTGTLHDTMKWNTIFKNSSKYKNLKAKLYTHDPMSSKDQKIDIKDLQIGDLVFKMNGSRTVHVGMVFRNEQDSLCILNSKGSPRVTCDSLKNDKSGPVVIKVNSKETFGPGTAFGVNFHVIRFEHSEETIRIETQVWMRKNLDVSWYENGDPIRYAPTSQEWNDATNKQEGAWCYYNNDPKNGAIYGKLYNWYAVNDSRGLAPVGYHIPSELEWYVLSEYLGGDTIAGYKMKSETGWVYDGNGDNSSGFNALPGGCRNSEGSVFNWVTGNGFFWGSSDNNTDVAWTNYLDHSSKRTFRKCFMKGNGFSVRCLKD